MSSQAESMADCYVCERCSMYFHREALDFTWQPIHAFNCPNCRRPWTRVPALPAPPAVTHTGPQSA